MSTVERVWYGSSPGARLLRAALAPAELAYAMAVRVRGGLYDRGVLRVHPAQLPVLSVGNVTVGGTGKTPVAAWAVERLRARGARPAVVLRGYGDDEPLVHQSLNPGTPVITDADRVRGVEAARRAGADCVVLDDAFQHRRLARSVDWVLVAAERFERATHLLPAGPLREPRSAIARANVALVTRKTASPAEALELARRVASSAGVATAVVHLAPSALVDVATQRAQPVESLRSMRIVAVAAVGEPDAFFAQLRGLGAVASRECAYRDHHRFAPDDVDRLVQHAANADAVVCTLKDAVKLAPLWPRGVTPLWYVSQRAHVEHGAQVLDASLAMLLAARAISPSTAGPAG